MKSGKVWCLAIGVFLGASVIPAANAQKQPGKQNSSPSSNKNQHGAGTAQFGDAQGQAWSYVFSADNQGSWLQSDGSHSEFNLAAADDSVREHLNLPKGQGIVVNWVTPNSGAARAGIQENDVLLMLGESPLGKPADLYDRLKQAGEKPVPLALLRSGSRVTLQVQPLIRVSLRPVTPTLPTQEYWIGISVTPLEPVLRAQLRLSANHKVLVSEVFPGSPAEKAGIALYDIIVALDEKPVTDPQDVAKSVQAKGEKPLMLELIGKGGKSRTVAVTPERKKATETSQEGAHLSNVFAYDVVRPGLVLDSTNAITPVNQLSNAYLTQVLPIISELSSKSQDAGPALTQRLDALDSELKELRKLVEALQKTASMIIEQKKSSPE